MSRCRLGKGYTDNFLPLPFIRVPSVKYVQAICPEASIDQQTLKSLSIAIQPLPGKGSHFCPALGAGVYNSALNMNDPSRPIGPVASAAMTAEQS